MYCPPVKSSLLFGGLLLLSGALSGCVLAPKEAKDEAEEMRVSGQVYERSFEKRELPGLPPEPTADDLLRRAFAANGELEASYHQWAAAVHRIDQAGGYPNTPLSASFNYMFSGGGTKAFDRTSVTLGPDPMENLAFPLKTYQAGKVAFDDARAAGKRFRAAKFAVQRRVLNAWLDYALLAEKVRVQGENVSLLKLLSDTAVNRVQAGGPQQDLIRSETEYRLAENEEKNLEAKLPQLRAMLNAMMARRPDEALRPPNEMPAARAVPLDDAALLSLAATTNPELSALAEQVRGRRDAITLAKLQYIPDFNPFTGFTGTVSQAVGLGISIPTFLPEVRGRVREARSELREMLAMYRQKEFDQAAGVVAALYALRNSERQADLFRSEILPAAERVLELSRQSYAAGSGTFTELVESQRTLLEVRLGLSEARAAREQSLADLEALIGVDMASITPAATKPVAHPESGPVTSASTSAKDGTTVRQ